MNRIPTPTSSTYPTTFPSGTPRFPWSVFAAVSGHDEALYEAARFTEEQLELSEDEMNAIDEMLQRLRKHIKEQPEVTITCFKPDETKNGGAYVTVTGSAKKVEKVLILQDGTVIPIEDVISVNTRLE